LISIFVRSGIVVSLVAIPVGLIVSLVYRFWGHNRTYESNHFLGQGRKAMMTTTPTSSGNQTTKVKRPKEGGFCVTFYFWVLFCGKSFFFPLCFCQAQKISLSPKV
jgi:hypothetical protein